MSNPLTAPVFDTKLVDSIRNAGISTVIFGCIGLLMGIVVFWYFIMNGNRDPVSGSVNPIDPLVLIFVVPLLFIFCIASQIFLIIFGQYLVRHASSHQTKKIIIANLVVGMFTNIAVLVIFIVALDAISSGDRNHINAN